MALRSPGARKLQHGLDDASTNRAVSDIQQTLGALDENTRGYVASFNIDLGILPATGLDPAASASPIATPVTLTFSTAAGTADATAYTVPASPSGVKRLKCSYVVVRLTTAITGGGTVVIRAGTSAGGNDLLVDSAAWTNATAVGAEVGMSIADLGTGFPASTGYVAQIDAAGIISVRATTGGGGISGGAATIYVYGCLETS